MRYLVEYSYQILQWKISVLRSFLAGYMKHLHTMERNIKNKPRNWFEKSDNEIY
jgi:hypothetical protein